MRTDEPRPMRVAEVVKGLRDAPYDRVDHLVELYAHDSRRQVQAAVASAMRRHAREKAERERVAGMYALQFELAGEGVVIGVDEVGRGAVAGPLYVAAVVLPREPMIWGLDDSKRLSPRRREEICARVVELASAVGMASVEPSVIDEVGMAAALRIAMAGAIADTGVNPDVVLIDGSPVHVHERERCVVKGDARVACIAAASVVAKVARDHLMVSLDADYPGYHLAECKGYGSAAHVRAIREMGLTAIHRRSFCGNFLKEIADV